MVGLAAAGGLLLLGAMPSRAAPPGSVSASFVFAPAAPLSGQTVTFISRSTVTGKKNAIVDHRWDLDGNGTFETDTGAQGSAAHAYPFPGAVAVALLTIDSGGRTSVASSVVNVGNRPPSASFTYSPSPGVAGAPVTFSSTARDPEGQITELAWDLNGDGSYDNGSGPTALRSFDRAGSFVVGLRVTDSRGASVFSSRAITVVAPSAPSGTTVTGGSRAQGSKGGLRLMNPFPVVRIVGIVASNGTRVRLLRVDAPRGAKVSVRCKGRGCPFRKQVRVAKQVRLQTLERLLRPGVTVRIFVTSRDAIGKYTRFRTRRGEPPARADRCLLPGSWRPVSCPEA
jgi:PKD domain-containing protein